MSTLRLCALLNAGSGVTIPELVDGTWYGTLSGAGAYQWAPGGGVWFPTEGSGFLFFSGAGIGGTDGPIIPEFTVVAGINMGAVSGSRYLASKSLTNLKMIDGVLYSDYATHYFVNGTEGTGPLVPGVEYVIAYHCPSIPWGIGLFGYGYSWKRLAFVYIYEGAVDVALMARLGSNPYAMFTDPVVADDIEGDPDWGSLRVEEGVSYFSPVVEMGDAVLKTLTAQRDRYGDGRGTVRISVRGSATWFREYDISPPDWVEYTAPLSQEWRWAQLKLEYVSS